MSRFNRRNRIRISKERNKQYKNMLRKRGLKFIDIFSTPRLAHITGKQMVNLELVGHTWRTGDRYFKLAHRYYGDSEMWWVIAWFNRKPTEAHLKVGDPITIPLPLDKVLSYLKV